MSTIESATDVVKFHISLNTSDLTRSITFYRVLFGIAPAKVKADYAKFELAEPPVILSLIPIPPSGAGHVNHVGLRLLDSAALVAIQLRLEQSGFATQREDGVECCYSKQTKFWVNDPDGALWELYVLHADVDEHDDHGPSAQHGLVGNSTFRGQVATIGQALPPTMPLPLAGALPLAATPTATVYRHILTQPVPERIEHADAAVDEVQLQGTLNMKLAADRVRAFLREARRVLRPGGTIETHMLTSNRELTERPTLPGPASLVEHVWTEIEAASFFAEAGFVGIRFTKLGDKPCFTVGDVQLRETKLAASNPAAACDSETTVEVLYRGPLAELRDDYGNVLPRGERKRISFAAAKALKSLPQFADSLQFTDDSSTGGCCS